MDNCRIIEQFNVVKILLEKIQILDQNTIEIILTLYWNSFSKKRTLINWIDVEKLDWDMLSININAINLLKENPNKINWKYLSMNPSAIELLKENQDKIYWYNLSSNPNAMNEYHKFSGYLNLMEGDPEESIKSYANLSKEVMGNDSYHVYFLALAKKSVGDVEESNLMFSDLANDNFATWQNSIVKNLAKSQVKVNI